MKRRVKGGDEEEGEMGRVREREHVACMAARYCGVCLVTALQSREPKAVQPARARTMHFPNLRWWGASSTAVCRNLHEPGIECHMISQRNHVIAPFMWVFKIKVRRRALKKNSKKVEGVSQLLAVILAVSCGGTHLEDWCLSYCACVIRESKYLQLHLPL